VRCDVLMLGVFAFSGVTTRSRTHAQIMVVGRQREFLRADSVGQTQPIAGVCSDAVMCGRR
jgi:hypothetical protein